MAWGKDTAGRETAGPGQWPWPVCNDGVNQGHQGGRRREGGGSGAGISERSRIGAKPVHRGASELSEVKKEATRLKARAERGHWLGEAGGGSLLGLHCSHDLHMHQTQGKCDFPATEEVGLCHPSRRSRQPDAGAQNLAGSARCPGRDRRWAESAARWGLGGRRGVSRQVWEGTGDTLQGQEAGWGRPEPGERPGGQGGSRAWAATFRGARSAPRAWSQLWDGSTPRPPPRVDRGVPVLPSSAHSGAGGRAGRAHLGLVGGTWQSWAGSHPLLPPSADPASPGPHPAGGTRKGRGRAQGQVHHSSLGTAHSRGDPGGRDPGQSAGAAAHPWPCHPCG